MEYCTSNPRRLKKENEINAKEMKFCLEKIMETSRKASQSTSPVQNR